METLIIAIQNPHKNMVAFSCLHGTGVAEWIGVLPIVGGVYDVELQVNDAFIWGGNIRPSKKVEKKIEYLNGQTSIFAKKIALEDDGCLVLSLEGIFFVDVAGMSPDYEGLVKLTVNTISLYSNDR